MRAIELNEGYMICTTCRGYIEADDKKQNCECFNDDASDIDFLYN